MSLLEINGLSVSAGDKKIISNFNLCLAPGELHALVGPNGSGKSSLAACLAGSPSYTVTQGVVQYNNADLLTMTPEQRAQAGLFLAFQHPTSIPGLTVREFLRAAVAAVGVARHLKPMDSAEFDKQFKNNLFKVGLSESFVDREVNVDLSGGEKKRLELVQMLMLKPTLAILDETDSGLDSDALKLVAEIVREQVSQGLAVLLITHYQRLLEYLNPRYVHIMINGSITRSGGSELINQIESRGYESFKH